VVYRSEAVQAAQQGLHVLDREQDTQRRTIWRIVLLRNLAVAYHFQGQLNAARGALEEAIHLAELYRTNSYLYDWTLYEYGLLEQRAGRLDLALEILRDARRHHRSMRSFACNESPRLDHYQPQPSHSVNSIQKSSSPQHRQEGGVKLPAESVPATKLCWKSTEVAGAWFKIRMRSQISSASLLT
jgi:tetratricopeptide (TPR) repeat protein